MKIRLMNLMGVALLLCIALQACGTPQAAPATNPPQPTQPAVVEPTNTATQPPVPTETPVPTEIKHLTVPALSTYIPDQTANDCIEGDAVEAGKQTFIPATCDNADANFIELPVTSDLMTYFPYLDIVRAQFGATKDWLFARIVVYDVPAPTGSGDLYYSLFLDLDMNGLNSNVVLISVKNLPAKALNWTTDGVQAWSDINGAIAPTFDSGVGADPDLIWVRRSKKTIEFAFKPALIHDALRFAWSAWAYQGDLTPVNLAIEGATSGVYEIDNTCAFGFNVSTTSMINGCR
jgi:hypothetical protein